jgi:predicted transposase YbfD/YdcC
MPTPIPMVACFAEIEDPRIDRTKRHLLVDIMCLGVLAVIAGAEGWEDIEQFGNDKHDWLKKFLKLPNGIPSHDTISRVFRLLKPAAIQAAWKTWIESLHEELGLKLIAVDGKTLRRSHDRRTMKSALHVVSAWSVANHVVLGQQSVDSKSNEITAIPELLQILELKGAIVSIDAIGCQKEIAKQVVDQEGDFVLAVKDNQPKLHAAIDQHFIAIHEGKAPHTRCFQHATHETSHGRKVDRYYYITAAPESVLAVAKGFKKLQSVGEVITVTRRDGKETTEVRQFICSIPPRVRQFASAVRGHWGIENSLHWTLDVTFREDDSRIRKDHGPDNFGFLRRVAITVIKQDKSPGSIRRKRKRAAWNNEALEKIAGLTP